MPGKVQHEFDAILILDESSLLINNTWNKQNEHSVTLMLSKQTLGPRFHFFHASCDTASDGPFYISPESRVSASMRSDFIWICLGHMCKSPAKKRK